MTDYERMLKLAGLNESTIARLTSEADSQETSDAPTARDDFERELGSKVKIAAQQAGLELYSNHPVFIHEDECEVKVDGDSSGIPLAQFLDFANKIASAGLGSNVKIAGSADLYISIYFTIVS